MEIKSNIRIIDIAKMAEVSVGTVDRILHNRGRVSEEKRRKVEKVLKEINYEPNMVARFLASKKSYTFAAITPTFSEGSYWELACNGIERAANELRNFNVHIKNFHFDQYNRDSFRKQADALLKDKYDGVIIATLFEEYVIDLSQSLDKQETPYIYIDSGISNRNDLAYFGGDSFISGQIAAKLLLKEIGCGSDIFFAYIKFKYSDVSVQMRTREMGFMKHLETSCFSGNIHHLELNPDDEAASIECIKSLLEKADSLVGGIVFNSRTYELINLLDKIDPALTDKIRLVGHDAIWGNVEALKQGKIAFLLSQRPDLQGYDAVKALGNYFLFKQMPEKVNYMPIDILMKENIDFYNNYKL